MAGNGLNVKDIDEAKRLWKLGLTNRQIARATKIHRNTINKYVEKFKNEKSIAAVEVKPIAGSPKDSALAEAPLDVSIWYISADANSLFFELPIYKLSIRQIKYSSYQQPQGDHNERNQNIINSGISHDTFHQQ